MSAQREDQDHYRDEGCLLPPDEAPPEGKRECRPSSITFSIVIPTLRPQLVATTLLPALGTQLTPGDEVIVVSDHVPWTEKPQPPVRFFLNRGRRGFAPTCNLGAATARGTHLFFLNDDVQLLPGLLDDLRRFAAQHPNTCFGPNLFSQKLQTSESKTEVHAIRGVLDARQAPLEAEHPTEVAYVTGAALVVPRRLFEVVGGFDERLTPCFWEDCDLGLSLKKRGVSSLVLPKPTLIHAHGQTTGTVPRWKLRLVYEKNRLIVTWKNLQRVSLWQHLFFLFLRQARWLVTFSPECLALPWALWSVVAGSGRRR